jgi:hypothetical protein
MEAGVKFVYAFLLIGSIQGIHAAVIGDPLIPRQHTDTATGLLYAYDGNFGTVGDVLTWSFYAGTGGHQITPVILDQSTSGGWTVTGIGTTQAIETDGSYTFDFGLVSGSSAVGPTITFGWYDGSADSANNGTISFDNTFTSVGYRDFLLNGLPVVGTAYTAASDFTGPNDGSDFTQGRIYSVQFDSLDSTDPPAAPEPSSLAMMAAGAFAVIASKRLR